MDEEKKFLELNDVLVQLGACEDAILFLTRGSWRQKGVVETAQRAWDALIDHQPWNAIFLVECLLDLRLKNTDVYNSYVEARSSLANYADFRWWFIGCEWHSAGYQYAKPTIQKWLRGIDFELVRSELVRLYERRVQEEGYRDRFIRLRIDRREGLMTVVSRREYI